jgi:hypothetical protein
LKIYQINKYVIISFIIIISAIFILQFNKLVNENSLKVNGDEIHTIGWGTKFFEWDDGKVPTVRVGEFNRWMVRIIYPFSIFYMNSYMGGEHFLTGWDYPGGYYLEKNFTNNLEWMSDIVNRDVNVQDYVFAQRYILGTILVGLIFLISFQYYIRIGLIFPLSFITLLFFQNIFNSQFKIFYSETVLSILLLLTILFMNLKYLRFVAPLFIGILSACLISTKITGVLIIFVAFIYLISENYKFSKIKKLNIFNQNFFLTYIIYFIAFIFTWRFINSYSESLFLNLNETLANVYHYKTGHNLTNPGFYYNLNEFYSEVGIINIFFYFVPVLFLIFLKFKENFALLFVFLITSFGLMSMLDAHIYISRNFGTIQLVYCLLSAYSISILFNSYSKIILKIFFEYFIVFVIFISSVNFFFFSDNKFNKILEKTNCKNIGLVGVDKNILDKNNKNDVTLLKNIEPPFHLRSNPLKIFSKYVEFDCLVIKRIKMNKQITNFFSHQMSIIPVYRSNDLFIFKKKNFSSQLKNKFDKSSYNSPNANNVRLIRSNNILQIKMDDCAGLIDSRKILLRRYPINEKLLFNDKNYAEDVFDRFDVSVNDLGECLLDVPNDEFEVKDIEFMLFFEISYAEGSQFPYYINTFNLN